MRNIDEKTFSAILERIEALKNELSLLEEEVRALPVLPASEPVEEPAGQPGANEDLPEEATVAAGVAAELRPHSAAAQREWTRPGSDGRPAAPEAVEYGLTSTAAPAEQEPEVVVPETVEPEAVEIEPEPAVVEPVPEPVPEPVGMVRQVAATDADRMDFPDFLGDCHQVWHGAERFPEIIGVKSRDDHPFTSVSQFLGDIH